LIFSLLQLSSQKNFSGRKNIGGGGASAPLAPPSYAGGDEVDPLLILQMKQGVVLLKW
jgi:hypothetical protein